jgi:glycosyltransferase involved in cell wall biosynthesis
MRVGMMANNPVPGRIGLNLLYLLPGEVGGTETYAVSLIDALARCSPETEFVAFLNREAAGSLPLPPGVQAVICPVLARDRLARYRFEQLQLPWLARRHELDLMHSLGYVCPLLWPGPQVVTIHDAHVKLSAARMKRLGRSFFEARSAQRADAIIAPSLAAKRDIVSTFAVPEERVHVVHEAPKLLGRVALEDGSAALTHYGLAVPYIVAFSNASSHKNIARLVRGYTRLAERYVQDLVLIGHLPADPAEAAAIREAIAGGRVHALGFVPDADVPALLTQADAFVFPSWYEGFGLPALEAQMYGVPVICSSTASLPEVAGAGALYFDPFSDEDLVARLEECLASPERRDDLRRRGLENLKRFSWEKAGRETLAVYVRGLESAARRRRR